jgi:peptidyl-prolyl cis-trans isomerase C
MTDAEKAVTDEEASKYYMDNVLQFSQPEQVQASHILLGNKDMDDAAKATAKAKAEEVLKQVEAGGDFAALAKEHSTCPSKERGGDLGYFPKEQMVPEFANAAFAMKVGDVSDIVETQFGYHIIKVTGRKEAQTQQLDEVKETIIAGLKNKKRQEFWAKYRLKMREAAKIEKLEEFKVEEPPMMGGPAGAPGTAPKTVTITPKSADGETPAEQPKVEDEKK